MEIKVSSSTCLKFHISLIFDSACRTLILHIAVLECIARQVLNRWQARSQCINQGSRHRRSLLGKMGDSPMRVPTHELSRKLPEDVWTGIQLNTLLDYYLIIFSSYSSSTIRLIVHRIMVQSAYWIKAGPEQNGESHIVNIVG